MASDNCRSWWDLLSGKRYEKMLTWALLLSQGKSKQIFRKEMRVTMNAMVKQKAVEDKEVLVTLFYGMSLIQGVIFEALNGNKSIWESELEYHAAESLLICVFEPDTKSHLLAEHENRALTLYQMLGEISHKKKTTFSAGKLSSVIMFARQIIDEL